MKKRMIIVIIALIIVFGGIFGFDVIRSLLIRHYIKNYQFPPVTISTAVATTQSWQPTYTSVGSLTAVNSVNVTSQQSGMVTAISFKSGDLVEKGQALVQLDDSTDIQDLKNNQAQLTLNKINFGRQADLYRRAAVAKSDYDQAQSTLNQSIAMVDKTLVIISQKNIRAPFSGKIGISQVNLGQYVNPGDALVSLQSQDPIYVDFSLPEQNLKNLSVGQKLMVAVDSYPGEKFEGTIMALNSLITVDTRNINIRGVLSNKDNRLYPGSFADVVVYLPMQESVITVPQTAVTYSLYGDTVYVVKEEGKDAKGQPILKVHQHIVKIGDMKDNKVIIKEGIAAGDVVVSAGQNKLQEGMRVVVDNSVVLNPPQSNKLLGQ